MQSSASLLVSNVKQRLPSIPSLVRIPSGQIVSFREERTPDHNENDSFCGSETSSSSTSSSSSTLVHDIRLEGWMFWERQDDTEKKKADNHPTFTKVYAVLRNEFLLLYRNDRSSERTKATDRIPLIQIAVARSGRTIQGTFHVEDPHEEVLKLHLYNRKNETIATQWEEALEQAAELTQSHFASFALTPDALSRDSMYRGTLHDFRLQRRSLRASVQEKFKNWASFRSFRRSLSSTSSMSCFPLTP